MKFLLSFLILIISFCCLSFVQAGNADSMLWGGYEGNVQTSTGLGNTDPREMAASVVNIVLGFLGIVFLGIIIFGVVAGAGDEGAETSKAYISAGVVGLVIVLAAYGIAQFVITALYGATGATG